MVERILKDEALKKELVCDAKRKIEADHSCNKEAQAYRSLIEFILCPS